MINKKRIIIIVLIIILLIGISIGIILFNNKINEDNKIAKGYEIFGNEICEKMLSKSNKERTTSYEKSGHPVLVGEAFSSWSCKICGKQDEWPNTGAPKLCDECAKITNRCRQCGKLLSETK